MNFQLILINMFYIYRLADGEQDYYGQTQDCKDRLRRHKSNTDKTCMSRLLNKNNMKLHVLHTLYKKQEADETEQFYILNMECVNRNVPCRTVKEYYQNNKDKRNEYQKEYYQNNKDIINEKRGQKFKCECGGKYTKEHKSTHFKTNKHKNYINR